MMLLFYGVVFGYALIDAQTIVNGAKEGIHMALTVVIPSLFPFIFLCTLSLQEISKNPLKFLRPVEKLCGMSRGSGILLLLGLIGGYPVGAQNISKAYENRMIARNDAERMLGFCNNAGPSFIFGMVGGILHDVRLCWLLWLTQILSATITAALLPGKSAANIKVQTTQPSNIGLILEGVMIICAKIAGWVVLFRCLLSVLDKWCLPTIWRVCVSGILELSNGCARLQNIDSTYLQFMICGILLVFGGLCVHLQTRSVTKGLSLRYYWIGKTIQTAISTPILYILWKISVAF